MKKTILLALGFAAILVVIFHAFLFDSSVIMLNSDQLNGLGSRFLRVHDFLLTQWDDSRLGGIPTFDALFGDAFHPLVLTQWIMDPARAVGFKFIACVFIAFLSAYALFRKLTGRWELGALLGFLFALNPQFFTHIYGGHDGKMMVFSVAPLAVLGLIQIIREGRFSGMIILTFSIAWMLLSSHIQLTYFFLWGAGLFTLFEVFRLPLTAKQRTIRLSLATAGLALALGIGAFQVLPPYVYTTQQSVRGTGEHTTIGHATSWSLHQEELASMLVPGFLGTDVENEREYWGHNSFKLNHDAAGALLTFLAFLGLFVKASRRSAIFWFVGSAVALSYALGAHSPLFALWYKILPGVKNFRAPSMAIFWIPLAMAMMSVPVFNALRDKDSRAKLFPGLVLFGVLVAVVAVARFAWDSVLGVPGTVFSLVFGAVVIAALNLQDRNESFTLPNLVGAWTNGLKGSNKIELLFTMLPFILVAVVFFSAQQLTTDPDTAQYFQNLNLELMAKSASAVLPSALIVLAVAGVAWYAIASSLPLWQVAAILVAAASLDLFIVNKAYVQNVPRENYLEPENPVLQAIKADSPDSLQRPRILSVSRNPSLSGNVFAAYGMRNALGSHDNELASYREFRGGQSSENLLTEIQNNPFINLLNIGYIIYDTREGTRPMRNANALPIASLFGAYQIAPADSVASLLKSGFDYRHVMLLTEEPEGLPADARFIAPVASQDSNPIAAAINAATLPRAAVGQATMTASPKMDTQVFRVQTNVPALLLVSGNYHPYWKASIDGQSVKVLKAFGTLRAIAVPAGTHEVRMEYRSDILAKALLLTQICGALFFLACVGAAILASKKPAQADQINVPS